MLKCITLVFLLLGGQIRLLLLSKLQNLCPGISQQLNFNLFIFLMIITSFTICCCSVIHFFCATITSSQHHFSPNHTLLPHPNLAFKLTTPTHYITTITTISTCAISPPSCLHITALPLLLQSKFYFSLLDFIFYIYILHTFVLFCLTTRNNNVKSSPTIVYFSQIMHIIFQGLI